MRFAFTYISPGWEGARLSNIIRIIVGPGSCHQDDILEYVGWAEPFDWQDVGPRFLEPIPDGKYKGFTIAKWLPDMIWEYYKLSGRHERTGRPFKDTLENLGLQEFTPWSQEASHL